MTQAELIALQLAEGVAHAGDCALSEGDGPCSCGASSQLLAEERPPAPAGVEPKQPPRPAPPKKPAPQPAETEAHSTGDELGYEELVEKLVRTEDQLEQCRKVAAEHAARVQELERRLAEAGADDL